MLHLLRPAAARTRTYGLIGLLVLGLLVGVIRLALPFADMFRSELEDTLSETLGLDVRIGRFGLGLVGLSPQLKLRDVDLRDLRTGHPQLSLQQLRIELSLTASLFGLEPQIDAITLVGAQLVVKRLKNGAMAIAGLQGLKGGDPAEMAFFLGNGRFLVADSDLYWIDEKAGAPPLHLSDVRIRFENRDERHRIGILARLFDDPRSHLWLVGDLHGKPGRLDGWRGDIYLRWQDGNLSKILAGRLPEGLQLNSRAAKLESWSHLQDMAVTESLNRISTAGLTVASKSGKEATNPLHLDALEGVVRWKRLDKGWRLDIRNFARTGDEAPQPVSDLDLRYLPQATGRWTIEGGSRFLDLTIASDVLAALTPLLPEAFQLAAAVRPGGELHDSRFRLRHHPELPLEWGASGRAEGLSLHAHGHFPGIQGLNAELAASDRAGWLVLSGGDLRLDLPRLFPHPIRLDEMIGEIGWQRDADGTLQLGSQEIIAANMDAATRSRFSMSIPVGGRPYLDLRTEFGDIDVASVRDYLPTRRLKEKLATWLDRAFVSGRIPAGTLLFRGVPADFPFAKNEGLFEVLFGVENAVLDFNPQWPRIEAIVGEVQFLNQGLAIQAAEAKFLQSKVQNACARIPNLKEAVAVEIQGNAEGPFSDGLRVLSETPLHKRFGAIAEKFEAQGVSDVHLNMAIPLRHKGEKGPLRLNGEISWPGPAALAVVDSDIKLTELGGKLRFTEQALEAKAIEGKLWDVPVALRVDTRKPRGNGDAGSSIHLLTRGRFPTSLLEGKFPSQAWEPVKGRTRLELGLNIGTAHLADSVPAIDFELKSDLSGLALELPAPLGKSASESRRLRLSGRLAPKKPLRIQGTYGDLGINLGLSRDNADRLRLERGTLNLGGGVAPLPKQRGLVLSGSTATLDLEPWVDWWESRKASSRRKAKGGVTLRSVDIHAGKLLLTDAAFNDIQLDLERQTNRWEATIKGTQIDGTVTIPYQPRREPIRISLERLDLKGVLGQEDKKGRAVDIERPTDPRRSHALDLTVERLLWGENSLGQITIRSTAVSDGLDFTKIALTGPFMSIKGRGSWTQTTAGPRSHISLAAKGSDLGEFLRSLEFKSLFRKAPAELNLDLSWTGGPFDASAADLKGRATFDLGAGSLLEVEPGVGRMLGILNLEAIQRRLTLDFSDLFGRGYAFEKITGRLNIKNGIATIEKLDIEGPAADVSIAGSTNLVDRKFDQIVTVTPRIGTGVAIASGVAGGPLVGAAVFLADKVTGGVVDKLGRYRYSVNGPWSNPEIRRGTRASDSRAAKEGFFQDMGRAGAEASREPKGEQKGKSAGSKSGVSAHNPSSAREEPDENLFLEGF